VEHRAGAALPHGRQRADPRAPADGKA
jgi:hypothetical protein